MKRNFKKDTSGQVLIVTALLVATILLSTSIYVIETGNGVPKVSAENDVFSEYQQSVRSAMISALSNVTDGGNPGILAADLNELKTVILSNSFQSMLTMDYNTLNSSNYQNGLWISWSANGQGISSAYASFSFTSSSPSTTSNLEYAVNLTSTVTLKGNYKQLTNTTKQVDLTINVLNEGKPSLAQNLTFSCPNPNDWVSADMLSTTNFGNGTYTASFNVETLQQNDPMIVSLLCQDERGIFVGANATCTST